MAPQILTCAQAAAIYRAMNELSTLGMRIDAENDDIRVFENATGQIYVAQYDTEIYPDKGAFAAAYHLIPSVNELPQQALPDCSPEAPGHAPRKDIVAFAWRPIGNTSDSSWKVSFDMNLASDPLVRSKMEVRFMSWSAEDHQ